MEEIYLGIQEGLDVAKYSDPAYTGGQMSLIRHGLKRSLDISNMLTLNYAFM